MQPGSDTRVPVPRVASFAQRNTPDTYNGFTSIRVHLMKERGSQTRRDVRTGRSARLEACVRSA